jgi:lysozyme family protein
MDTPDRFSECLAFTLMYEGGRSNDPKDPGGRTNYGITQGTYNNWRASRGMRDQSVYLISAIDRDSIYKNEYWDAANCQSLPSGVDLCIFDLAVNSGVGRANKMRPLATSLTPDQAIREICVNRLSFMHSLNSWSRFGRGWGRRVAACETLGLRMAGADIKVAAVGASAEADSQKTIVHGVIVLGGAVAVTSWGIFGVPLAIVVSSVTIAILAIPAFNEWRHSQRNSALSGAAAEIKKAEIAAGITRTIALSKSIAAEKAEKEGSK